MHDGCVQAAGRDRVQAEELVLTVEVHRPEVFSGFSAQEIKETDDVRR